MLSDFEKEAIKDGANYVMGVAEKNFPDMPLAEKIENIIGSLFTSTAFMALTGREMTDEDKKEAREIILSVFVKD